MTLDQFRRLVEPEKIHLLHKYGDFVAERIEMGNKIFLYQIFSFYVEVYCIKTKTVHLQTFSDTEKLAPYIKKIDITGIQGS